MADVVWDDEAPVADVVWDEEPKKKPKASEAKSLLGGLLQGSTLDFGDEILGGVGKLLLPKSNVKLGSAFRNQNGDSAEMQNFKRAAMREEAARPTNYELSRDLVREDLEAARQANPGVFTAGQLGGGLLTMPLGGQATGLKALTKTGALLGVGSGLGSSDADLTRGEFDKAAVDAALGGVLGAGAAAAGVGLGEAGKWVAGKAARGLTKAGAWARNSEKNAIRRLGEMADDVVRRGESEAAGHLGGEQQAGNRMVENYERLADKAKTPEQKAAVKALRESGMLEELESELLDSTLEKIPGQKRVIETARSRLENLKANRDQAFAEAYKAADDVKAQISPRVKRYAAPIATALLGGTAGGIAGIAAGADPIEALGTAGLGASIRPGIASFRRLMQNPAVVRRVAGVIGRALPKSGKVSGEASREGAALVRSMAAMLGPAPRQAGAAALARVTDDEDESLTSR